MKQAFIFPQHGVHALRPLFEAQFLALLRGGGGRPFRLLPGNDEMAEFRVREQLSAQQQGRADAGAESQENHAPGAGHGVAVGDFGQACGVRVV